MSLIIENKFKTFLRSVWSIMKSFGMILYGILQVISSVF